MLKLEASVSFERKLICVGCDSEKRAYVCADESIFVLDGDELNLVRSILKEEQEQTELEVFGMCFDTSHRFYLSSNWYGLQVFSSVNEAQSQIEFECSEWRGPINLSHPSGELIAINYYHTKEGEMKRMGWKDGKFMIVSYPCWGGNHGDWFFSENRHPTTSLRRSWYPDRIMMYFIDELSSTIPEDGIRSLHLMYASPDRRSLELEHTFMSCPWNEDFHLPFCIEIPHNEISSELLLLTPRGVITERGKILLEFDDYLPDETYTSLHSATDIEGAGSKRSTYVLAYQLNSKMHLKVFSVERDE